MEDRMSEENEVKETQATSQEVATTEQKPSGDDAGALIQENKKYRQRAQDAEAELEKINAERKAEEQRKLEEEGRFKELLEQRQAELEVVSKKASDWDDYEKARRDALLERLPEEQHKFAAGMNLATLEAFVETSAVGGGGSPPAGGTARQRGLSFDPSKPWTDMSDAEKDEYMRHAQRT